MPSPTAVPAQRAADPQEMRQAGPDLLSLALIDARNHTLDLLAQFEGARDRGRAEAGPATAAHPASASSGQREPSALAIAGHIGWFAEAWISRNMQRAIGPACPHVPVRLASIEPRADEWWDPALHGAAQASEPPSGPAVRAYLLETLEATLELLERAGDEDAGLYFYRLALFHEDLRGEELIVLAQSCDVALQIALAPGAQSAQPLLVPALRWQLGSAAGGFVFDNEKWAHEVDVPEFEIDAQAVAWSQFVEFVADGGYDRPDLWLPEGWAWLESKSAEGGRRAPRYVDQIGAASGAVLQRRFGSLARMGGNQSAMHVSWWEADAWCRWAGRRLPAEVEWEAAVLTAARRGLRWGGVHEWTASTFRHWPGFSADPWADYSLPWFGRAKVRRGASFATSSRMRLAKLRGFALPGEDAAFCGFRSCAP